MNPSCNLFVVGPTGAGKTSLGRRLAHHYGLELVDLDQEIEQTCGVPINTIFEVEGEAGFRRRESHLLDEFSLRTGILLVTGGGAVLDPLNRQRLHARGYVIWLQATPEQQLERLRHDTQRPLLAGTDRQQRLQAMAAIRNPLYLDVADQTIPGLDENVAAASERCIALVDAHWQRQHAA
ncbi:shikimate kinase [Dyella sp. A6]|uniref:shikimate kinase n=1 Tax=Dyella aluminiiresistens TaxID=3069105 RepID=UPI002E759BAB|nr:shikimate kinase [Dyella sp. A6]